MSDDFYIMSNEEETLRLDRKTDKSNVEKQARWAGIKSGMRVADLGFGSGKTTFVLNRLVQPGGECIGVDIVKDRIEYANRHYNDENTSYLQKDIRDPLDDLGEFDFIWVRFVLEYHRAEAFNIVRNIAKNLKEDGILCLIDLDYNCLSHYGLTAKLEKSLTGIMDTLKEKSNFDPYVGRKLYAFLYDLNFQDIDLNMEAHHLIFGKLNEVDEFNWIKKVEVAAKNSGYDFEEYDQGYEAFFKEFKSFFSDPRRFTYTPVISCRGKKPIRD